MDVYLDATTLIALGTVGELDILTVFDGKPIVPEAVVDEVTTEPARTNVERFCSQEGVHGEPVTAVDDGLIERAKQVLDEDETNGDVQIIADVLAHTAGPNGAVGVVSDDRRVRTVADGLGATVTGTVGVVVRATESGMDERTAKRLVERIDSHGLHMTGGLRQKAYELIEEAAERRTE